MLPIDRTERSSYRMISTSTLPPKAHNYILVVFRRQPNKRSHRLWGGTRSATQSADASRDHLEISTTSLSVQLPLISPKLGASFPRMKEGRQMPKVQCPFDTCRSSTRPIVISVLTGMTIGLVSDPRLGYRHPEIQAKDLRRAQTAWWSLVLVL
jgi:hypothetical protein